MLCCRLKEVNAKCPQQLKGKAASRACCILPGHCNLLAGRTQHWNAFTLQAGQKQQQ